jgi:hypothetical protein
MVNGDPLRFFSSQAVVKFDELLLFNLSLELVKEDRELLLLKCIFTLGVHDQNEGVFAEFLKLLVRD